MKPYVVTILGTRSIQRKWELEWHLEILLGKILQMEPNVKIYVCGYGSFHCLATSIIHRLRKELDHRHCELILLLTHQPANMDALAKRYDRVVTPSPEYSSLSSQKATELRNKWAVKHADSILFYTHSETDSVYQAMLYAEELERDFSNLDLTLMVEETIKNAENEEYPMF